MQNKIKIFIVDDDNLTIDLVVKSLNNTEDIAYIGRANSGEDCLKRLDILTPDIVLMDINMPGIDGIETAEKLLKNKKECAPKIIFLTVYNDEVYSKHAFNMKASFLGKNISIDYLISTIKRVNRGEVIYNPNPSGIIKKDINAKLRFVIKNTLNPTQIEIAKAVRDGKTSLQIAEMLLKNENIQMPAEQLRLKKLHVDNQKREISQKLERCLDIKIKLGSLGAIMERSGLCPPLEIGDLNNAIKKIRQEKKKFPRNPR